jgi:hypothetical protein
VQLQTLGKGFSAGSPNRHALDADHFGGLRIYQTQFSLDGGNDWENTGGQQTKGNEPNTPNPVPLTPLRFEARPRRRERRRFGCGLRRELSRTLRRAVPLR